jgi:hypothetical protein
VSCECNASCAPSSCSSCSSVVASTEQPSTPAAASCCLSTASSCSQLSTACCSMACTADLGACQPAAAAAAAEPQPLHLMHLMLLVMKDQPAARCTADAAMQAGPSVAAADADTSQQQQQQLVVEHLGAAALHGRRWCLLRRTVVAHSSTSEMPPSYACMVTRMEGCHQCIYLPGCDLSSSKCGVRLCTLCGGCQPK